MLEAIKPTPGNFDQEYNITTKDERTLRVSVRGGGTYPIIDFHGSPSSRKNIMPRNFILSILDVHVISYDRPGYGESTRHRGRLLGDSAKDAKQIIDKLGYERVGVIARSGGLAHALGFAALCPDRVTGLFGMSGLSPQAFSANWTANMTNDNKKIHAAAENIEDVAVRLEAHGKKITTDKFAIVKNFFDELPASDKHVLGSRDILNKIADSHYEGLRQSAAGWIDDTIAVNRMWNFSLDAIECPAIFWHGVRDPFASPFHASNLQRLVPQSKAIIHQQLGHFGGILNQEAGLAYLRDRAMAFEQTGKHVQLSDAELKKNFVIPTHTHNDDPTEYMPVIISDAAKTPPYREYFVRPRDLPAAVHTGFRYMD